MFIACIMLIGAFIGYDGFFISHDYIASGTGLGFIYVAFALIDQKMKRDD